MSSFDYARLQATAARLIKRFGKPAVLHAREPVVNDRPWESGANMNLSPITVVVDSYTAQEADGQLIRLTDTKLLVAPGNNAPGLADSIAFDGKAYNVIDVQEHKPGPVLLYWTVQARR